MGLTDKMCRVTVEGEVREYPKGTAYQRIAEEFQDRYEHQIILAYEGAYRLRELSKTLEEDCSLRFVTTADRIGHSTYKRSMCFLLVKAVHDVAGHDRIDRVRIHFSLDKGYYCTVEGDVCLDERFLERVAGRMRELSEQKIPIDKRSVHTEEAVALFHRHGMYDKERLFEYRRVSKVNIYSINEFEDYFYGYMAPDAGCLKYFSLHLYDGGFVIQMPVRENPEEVPEFHPSPKLFHVLEESVRWGDCQGIDTVGALNDMITRNDMRETVLVQEAHQERQIGEIAKMISDRGGVKYILVAGPSSSGKTTFSHRLAIQLRVNGLKPHPIAVDNYFVDREHTPRDKDGNYNFECLEAIDIDKFNTDMRDLADGKEVRLPVVLVDILPSEELLRELLDRILALTLDRRVGCIGEFGQGIEKRDLLPVRIGAKLLDARAADRAPWRVDDPQEAGIVVAVDDEFEIAYEVTHLLAVEEARSP